MKAKVDAYGRRPHRHISAYLIEVPLSEVNGVTGEPSPNLIKAVSEKMDKNQ